MLTFLKEEINLLDGVREALVNGGAVVGLDGGIDRTGADDFRNDAEAGSIGDGDDELPTGGQVGVVGVLIDDLLQAGDGGTGGGFRRVVQPLEEKAGGGIKATAGGGIRGGGLFNEVDADGSGGIARGREGGYGALLVIIDAVVVAVLAAFEGVGSAIVIKALGGKDDSANGAGVASDVGCGDGVGAIGEVCGVASGDAVAVGAKRLGPSSSGISVEEGDGVGAVVVGNGVSSVLRQRGVAGAEEGNGEARFTGEGDDRRADRGDVVIFSRVCGIRDVEGFKCQLGIN